MHILAYFNKEIYLEHDLVNSSNACVQTNMNSATKKGLQVDQINGDLLAQTGKLARMGKHSLLLISKQKVQKISQMT